MFEELSLRMLSTMISRSQDPNLPLVRDDHLHSNVVQLLAVPRLPLLQHENVVAVFVLRGGKKRLNTKSMSALVQWLLVNTAGLEIVTQTLAATIRVAVAITKAALAIIKAAIKMAITLDSVTELNHLFGTAMFSRGRACPADD
ncbi:hypothetical protein R1sor_004742 [Riccia sorocarpa]|uniref:Uncharacterized protein n=1 Tax=Riccia sorocarpa TaxID=122646 RepID=A0ABD3HLU9_9MARC